MHKNAPFCTDACNTPVYYTPVSVHPTIFRPFFPIFQGSASGGRNLFCSRPNIKRAQRSRLSFPATEPMDPRRIPKGSLNGSLNGFGRFVVPVSAEGPFKTPSKRLQEPFENPFKKMSKSMTRWASRGYFPCLFQKTKQGEKAQGNFARVHAGPVFALARIQNFFMRDHSPHMSQILEGIQLGANTCRACVRTLANTGRNSGRIIYILVCQGGNLTQARTPQTHALTQNVDKFENNFFPNKLFPL